LYGIKVAQKTLPFPQKKRQLFHAPPVEKRKEKEKKKKRKRKEKEKKRKREKKRRRKEKKENAGAARSASVSGASSAGGRGQLRRKFVLARPGTIPLAHPLCAGSGPGRERLFDHPKMH
jgi:outer membrane biosynthesis protein TonB